MNKIIKILLFIIIILILLLGFVTYLFFNQRHISEQNLEEIYNLHQEINHLNDELDTYK